MRRFVLSFVFLLCAGVSWAVSPAKLKDIAGLINSLFPPVEGFVVGVKGDLAVIDLGSKNRVYRGMVLTVSEKGQPFRNPITGEIIGYTERVVGYLQVLETYPYASLTRVYPLPGAVVKAGDIVRITRAKVNLFIFPIVDNTGEGFNILAFSDSLRKHLEKTGRFNVMGEERVIQEVSAYKGGYQEEGLLLLFNRLYREKYEAFFALYGRIEKEGNSYFFTGSVYCLNIGKKVRGFRVYLGEAGWRPSFEEEVVYASAPQEGRGYTLSVGDVNGDGVSDVVYVVDNVVHIVSYSRDKRVFYELGSFKVPITFKVFNADLVDIDGDGKAELLLLGSDVKDFSVSTIIYRWAGGSYRKVEKVDEYFLKAYRLSSGTGGVAQYIFKEDPLSIPPYRAEFKGLKFEKGKGIEWLKGDLILGASFFDANGDGVADILVNEDGRVVLKDGRTGEVLSDLVGDYGNTGYAFFYREPQVKVFYEGEGFLEISKEDYARFKELTLTVPGRIAVYTGGEHPFVAVFKNKPFVWGAFFDPFKSGTVKLYRWNNGYFEDTGWVRTLPEGIEDVALADVDGDGRVDVVLLTVRGVRTRKEGLKFNTRLVIYRGPGA